MISVKELEFMCKKIAFEYGHDAKVCLRIHDENDIKSDYVRSFHVGKDGTLYLGNKLEDGD